METERVPLRTLRGGDLIEFRNGDAVLCFQAEDAPAQRGRPHALKGADIGHVQLNQITDVETLVGTGVIIVLYFDWINAQADITRVPVEPYHCGNCDSPLTDPAAHLACMHGYMTGCLTGCGQAYDGGYSVAQDAESGPPCQPYVNELEIGILAGNTTYREEYEAVRARWSDIRSFTSALRDL